jgi:WXG100 family type VII secretion target
MALSYTFSDLEELSGAIGKAESNVQAVKADIHSSSGTLSSHWNSDKAQVSWATEQSKWDKACDNLNTALHSMAQKILLSSTAMEQTEAKNAGLFSG